MSLAPNDVAPPLHPAQNRPQKPVTGMLVERILGRSIAVIVLVFGAQAIPFAVMQATELKSPFSAIVPVILFGSFAAVAAAGFTGKHVATAAAFVPIAYLVALATWPLAVAAPELTQSAAPWLWYVCNAVLACAVFAFSPTVAAIYTLLIPTVFFFVLRSPSGSGAPLETALLNAVYMVILGFAVMILVLLLRRASQDVDESQNSAIERYSDAVRAHATEVERVQVDSIVHDGVLTALISAGKAETGEAQALASTMATVSMARLVSAAATPRAGDQRVALRAVRDRLDSAREHLDPAATLTPAEHIAKLELPARVAETLGDAAIQAMVNSRQHAGTDVSRFIRISVEGSIAQIIVADDGQGFDTSVKSERLGVRVSILERVHGVGGEATIDSAPGRGTVVTLRWPRMDAAGEAADLGPDTASDATDLGPASR